MVRQKDSEILSANYITNLINACKNYVLEHNATPSILKVLRNQSLIVKEAITLYEFNNPVIIQKYLNGKIPSLTTIGRSLNKVSPKENGCSSNLRALYDIIISMYEKSSKTLDNKINIPEPQELYWAVNFGSDIPGAYISGLHGEFIDWETLKKEITTQVINSLPGIIEIPATLHLLEHYDKKNWIVGIHDNKNYHVGDVWIGSNPENNWKMDGKIRIGKTISDSEWTVWQTYQRFTDGSYRVLKSI